MEKGICYTGDGKVAIFGDMRYTRDDKTGYYLNSTARKRLHREVWRAANGEIPTGWHIHHIDGDKGNNSPENLTAMPQVDHERLHGEELSAEQRQRKRDNIRRNAAPRAAEWHGSEEGIRWHRENYWRNCHAKMMVERDHVCDQCGKIFTSPNPESRFCSGNCKAKWRRDTKVDHEMRICPACGSGFEVNKYAKTECCSRTCAQRLRAGKKRGIHS